MEPQTNTIGALLAGEPSHSIQNSDWFKYKE